MLFRIKYNTIICYCFVKIFLKLRIRLLVKTCDAQLTEERQMCWSFFQIQYLAH